jgi:DNA-binding beta-propeller fold protein YncE
MDIKKRQYQMLGSKGVFRTPIGITEDDTGIVYITDSGAGAIFSYNLKSGSLQQMKQVRLTRPTGIAWSNLTKSLYVTDTTSHQVIAIDREGHELYRIGKRGYGQGEFNYPTDLFVDDKGRLYVTDALNARIQIFSADGQFIRTFGRAGDTSGSFAKPKGVAVDSEGHIYVCDALFDTVQIFDDNGQLLLAFGSRGTGNGEFAMPSGIYIDGSDTIYVADSFNRRVQVFKYLKLN